MIPKGTAFCWGHVEDTARGYVQAMILAQGLKKCGYPCAGEKLASTLSGLSGLNTNGLTYAPVTYAPKHTGLTAVTIQKQGPDGEPVDAAPVLSLAG